MSFSSYTEVDDGAGHIRVAWASEENVALKTGTTLLNLTFTVAENDYDYGWINLDGLDGRNDDLWCSDQNGEWIDVQLERGGVRTLDYIPGCFVAGHETPNTDDVLAMMKYFVGYDDHGISDNMLGHLDVNNDGRANLFDATVLLQYIAGWGVRIY